MKKITNKTFYEHDAITVARSLIGKILVRKLDTGEIIRSRITETESYLGEMDEACHAHKGRTKRTEVMYHKGGTIYIYLIYGMYNMLNIVTHKEDIAEAVLIRATEDFSGPGKITREMHIDRSYNDKSIITCDDLWIEDDKLSFEIETKRRINIDYASDEWKNKPWRFILVNKKGEESNED